MTPQESIETIKCNYPPSNYSMLREALDMAIEALEKQIPKKPIDNEECKWFECPTCGGIVVQYYRGTAHHCKCGQAIDWSEEK